MTGPLTKAVTTLIDVMSHDEREAVATYLGRFGVAPLPLAGDLTRFIGSLFAPGDVLIVGDIVAAARQRRPEVTQKQVYNALVHLTRRGAIWRVSQGRYAALPADPVAQEDQPDGLR